MNPPSALHSAMSRERKPFTYTPGGLDLSEIKSERMAKRLMRNAMNEGVPQIPVQQVQSPPATSNIAVPNFNCLPVQVFPAFNLPANPKSLLRTRSHPNQPREPIVPKVQQPQQFPKPNKWETSTSFYPNANNNNASYQRPTSMYEYNASPNNSNTLPRMSYGSSEPVSYLPEISYDAEYLRVPRNNNGLNSLTAQSVFSSDKSEENDRTASASVKLKEQSTLEDSEKSSDASFSSNFNKMSYNIDLSKQNHDNDGLKASGLPIKPENVAAFNYDFNSQSNDTIKTTDISVNSERTLSTHYSNFGNNDFTDNLANSNNTASYNFKQSNVDSAKTTDRCEDFENDPLSFNIKMKPQCTTNNLKANEEASEVPKQPKDTASALCMDSNKENCVKDNAQPDTPQDSENSTMPENIKLDLDFSIEPISLPSISPSFETKLKEDVSGENDEQREVKVVKKQVKKESKSDVQNGDQNGDAEAQMTVKLPTKKSAAKTETKVEVVQKQLPDGSIEEVKTTITKTTVDGKTTIATKTETTIIPKEEEEEEEYEEEEEQEEEETGDVVQEVKDNDEEVVSEVVVVKKSPAVVQNGEKTKIITEEEHSETTVTKKVAVVQQQEAEEEEEEEVEEEVEQEEIKGTVELKDEPKVENKEVEESEIVEEEVLEKVEVKKEEVEVEEEEEVVEEVSQPEKIEVPETPVEENEQEEVEEEYEEAEEKVEKKVEKTEESKLKEDDSENVDEEYESEKEEVTKPEPEAAKEEPEQKQLEPEPEEIKVEEKKEPEEDKPEPQPEPKVEAAVEPTVPLREPSIPLEKVEDVEIKPIGATAETITKSQTQNTEIITSNERPLGPISTQTEYNRIENVVTVNRTTKTLDSTYEQLTQHGIPTVKAYFAPGRERISTSPQPSKPYQPVYPPAVDQPQERRHSLLLERLSTERQIPSSEVYQNNYQYNNQTYEQQRQWSQEPQAEVLTVSNVKPSTITNSQWYQQNQSRKDNILYNNVAPASPAPPSQQWTQSYLSPQAPLPPQTPVQPPVQSQPQYQPTYTNNTTQDRNTTSTYQQNNYQTYTPTPATWVSNTDTQESSTYNTQQNQYSLRNQSTTESYQKSTQQYSSSYVPPPWEQDSSYVVDTSNQNYYQPPPQSSTYTPSAGQGWTPAPPKAKFSKPPPTAYIPPAPNQSFVKPVNTVEPPRVPGKKTYYSEYERRYITVPESNYIPGESKYQPQPDPSPQYYYDNNEPVEAAEPQWRKELREFTEKTSQTTEQTSVKPPWEEDSKYAKPPPSSTYTPTPTWSQTLRPNSYRERSFESEYVGSQEFKTNTLGRGRPLSSYAKSNVDTIPERVRGVSVDRYNPNSYQAPVVAEHPPVQTHTLNVVPPVKSYHNPNVPAYHAQSRASAEPREQPIYPQPRQWEARASPLQSRSFKYLQWITGTDD